MTSIPEFAYTRLPKKWTFPRAANEEEAEKRVSALIEREAVQMGDVIAPTPDDGDGDWFIVFPDLGFGPLDIDEEGNPGIEFEHVSWGARSGIPQAAIEQAYLDMGLDYVEDEELEEAVTHYWDGGKFDYTRLPVKWTVKQDPLVKLEKLKAAGKVQAGDILYHEAEDAVYFVQPDLEMYNPASLWPPSIAETEEEAAEEDRQRVVDYEYIYWGVQAGFKKEEVEAAYRFLGEDGKLFRVYVHKDEPALCSKYIVERRGQ